jgi:hypothetical protein
MISVLCVCVWDGSCVQFWIMWLQNLMEAGKAEEARTLLQR